MTSLGLLVNYHFMSYRLEKSALRKERIYCNSIAETVKKLRKINIPILITCVRRV